MLETRPGTAFASLVAVFCLAVPAAAPQAQESGAGAYDLPETTVWDMEAAHGETYRIYVSKPEGDAPEEGYPVLYVLDGNAMFAGFAEARRIQSVYDHGLEDMIVVGIGYPNRELYDGRRLGDFTPPVENAALREQFRDYPSGKRAQFKRFLLSELRPEIARRYSVNSDRISLFGHSLGGLFALHVLYSDPGAFHAIIAASASIWWDDQTILTEEREFRARLEQQPGLGHGVRVTILVGELEEVRTTVDDNIALARRMEELSIYGVRSDFHLLENETHITVPSRSVTTAMRAALAWP